MLLARKFKKYRQLTQFVSACALGMLLLEVAADPILAADLQQKKSPIEASPKIQSHTKIQQFWD